MNRKETLNAYIRQVCEQIAYKDVHETIALELESHLAEKIEDYQADGYSEEEAAEKAIAAMGDPVALGMQLHHAHKPRMEWGVVSMVAVLIGIGLLTMYSLGISNSTVPDGLFGKQLFATIPGITVCAVMLFMNYRKLKRYSTYLYVATVLLMMYTLMAGTHVNGRPFLDLGFAFLNVIQASPFLLIAALAGIFADWDWGRRVTVFKASALFFLPFTLYTATPDFFAGMLFALAFLVLVVPLLAKRKAILGFVSLFTGSLSLFVYLTIKPYQVDRLLAFLNPYADPEGRGYLPLQSLKTIQSAGLWGNGFGSRLDTLPVTQSDFIFAYLVQSFGVVAGSLVMVIGVLLFIRLIRAVKLVKDKYGALLMSGLMTLFFTPYFWSIFMTVGLAPPFSVNLPLVSFGTVPFVMQMALIGLVLGIYRRKDIPPVSPGSFHNKKE